MIGGEDGFVLAVFVKDNDFRHAISNAGFGIKGLLGEGCAVVPIGSGTTYVAARMERDNNGKLYPEAEVYRDRRSAEKAVASLGGVVYKVEVVPQPFDNGKRATKFDIEEDYSLFIPPKGQQKPSGGTS